MAHYLFSAFADEASASVREQIAACKKNGIDYIELRNCDGKNISDFSVDEAKELKKTLDPSSSTGSRKTSARLRLPTILPRISRRLKTPLRSRKY